VPIVPILVDAILVAGIDPLTQERPSGTLVKVEIAECRGLSLEMEPPDFPLRRRGTVFPWKIRTPDTAAFISAGSSLR
jgi:hypothetical protein